MAARTKKQAQADIDAVNAALKDGFPKGMPGNTTAISAVREAARRKGINRQTFTGRIASAKHAYGIEPDWSLYTPKPTEPVAPIATGKVEARAAVKMAARKGGIRRFIVTCAQNNTHLHMPAWNNLMALADHYGADVLVSRMTYNKSAYGANSVKTGSVKSSDSADAWWPPEIVPYLCDERTELTKGLVFCGEMNIQPTAVKPLSGFESYTGRASGVFPHSKFAMESIASGKHEGTKVNWTTGTVTQRNYIQKRAGLRADFHHGYGALLVEIDKDGDWFVRQLNAKDTDGTICDLDLRVENGVVSTGHRVEAVNWGDVHHSTLEPTVEQLAWGKGGVFETLRPRYQFMHDLVDFRARNHHDRGNPHKMFQKYVAGADSVADEMARAAEFLDCVQRDWCQTVVVDSNHDNAAERWLREGDYKTDYVNAVFFLTAQLAKYRAIESKTRGFHLIEWALRQTAQLSLVRFLREDESFVICADANGGIECGMHGHLGPNGQRGQAPQFARMGRKANIGHSHSAGIVDGVYVAGITGALDQGYNTGPSSWTQSHIVTYETGKRAIVTFWNGKWRA